MDFKLGLRALALLAFVATSTAVIVKPELLGGAPAAALSSAVALSHT